ncbi:MAG: hypothetical protein FJW38_29635 [Acidobacteria bacterium]|nr:hypothetical protein [Acidobacteriota bacterium]
MTSISDSPTRAGAVDPADLHAAAVLLRDMGAKDVYLLGSAARNELRPDSDIDIAVRGVPPSRFFAAASRAADALGRPVDLVDLDVPSPTVKYILNAGILVRVL